MDVPQKNGLLFCVACAYVEPPIVGGERVGGPLCHHSKSYTLGDFDLVAGFDRRRFRSCREMRALDGACGRAGVLHSKSATPVSKEDGR